MDAPNDFVVGLGEDRTIRRAVVLRLKLAQHRKHDLSSLKISRGRFVHQLRDDRLALGDLFAPPIRNDDVDAFRAVLSKVDMFFFPRGRPFGFPDFPFWNRVCRGGLP